MLSLISWKSFIEVLLVLLGAYYLMVFVLYYPQEIWTLLRVKKTTRQIQPEPVVGAGEAKKTENIDPPEFALTNQIVQELKETIKKVMQDGAEKEDLLNSMAHVLLKCRELKNTPYGKAINNLIIRECGSVYGARLDEDEVNRIWG